MAKRKRAPKTARRRSRPAAKVRRHAPKSMPLAFVGGAIMSGAELATGSYGANKGSPSPVAYLRGSGTNKVQNAFSAARANIQTTDVLLPVAIGGLISIVGPKVPLVGRGANRLIKRMTKGKGSL